MIKVKNVELNTSVKEIIDTLQKELRKRGSQLLKRTRQINGYILVTCPYHKNGMERKPSAQFSEETGFFNCFACKTSKRLDRVISDVLHEDGYNWLLKTFSSVEVDERTIEFDLKREQKKKQFVDKSELTKYRFIHQYILDRHISRDVIRKFDVGYDKDFTLETKDEHGNIKRSYIGECITFPVKNEFGQILFIARRAIHQKLFHYPHDAEKPIYGLYELQREIKHGAKIDKIYVCESMINCLTLWTWGFYAVALNGTGTRQQIAEFKKLPYRHLVLALDNDDAGNKGARRLVEALKQSKIIDVVRLPKNLDVNDLTKEEFLNLKVVNMLI